MGLPLGFGCLIALSELFGICYLHHLRMFQGFKCLWAFITLMLVRNWLLLMVVLFVLVLIVLFCLR